MKTATENLENDHVHILRLIGVMEAITREPVANAAHLETIVWLIRNFADGLHHYKEENLLFPKMVEKGFSFRQGPIAVMMNDHEQGRKYVQAMADHIEFYKRGDQGAIAGIYENMRGYADLLKLHIGKENNVLFRMADNAFSEEEQQDLLDKFEKAGRNAPSGLSAEDYVNQLDTLAGAYNL